MLLLRKRRFTLLEVLLVLAMIVIVAGAVAINASRAIREQRFRSEVASVVNALRMAQQLMLILKADVEVKFSLTTNRDGINYALEFDDPLTIRWQKEIKRPHPPLKEIHSISFNKVHDKLTLRFFSGGTVMSRGVLRLSTHENPNTPGSLNSYICLPGFPHFIQAFSDEEDAACDMDKEDEYGKMLTQGTAAEIREKIRQYADEKK